MAERREEEEDAEEEEELIFPLWEKHMLDLNSWRESSHLALIGIKRVVGGWRGGGAMVVTNDLLSENGVFWWVRVVHSLQQIILGAACFHQAGEIH